MKLKTTIFIYILFLLTSCSGQTGVPPAPAEKDNATQTAGETVNQLSNNLMVVYQDKKNNYWFGSWQDGLFKYDGTSILHFSTKNGLPDNRVEEIREDRSGNVFINTSAGLCRYDGKQLVSIPETSSPTADWNLQPDDLWFKSTKPGHVCRYDGNLLTRLQIPTSKVGEDYLARNPATADPYSVYCIYKDSRGNIWFGMALMGALRYNRKSFDWISETDVTEMHDGPANGVRSIVEDKDGYFWFNSAYRYRVADRVSAHGKPFYERASGLGNLDGKPDSNLSEYLSVTKDKAGNLWIATYRHGVWKYDGRVVTHYPVQEHGKDIHLFYIYLDNEGAIWLGTHEHGVWKLNGEKFVRFRP